MPTTLNSGLQLPDKGSVDWYSSMQTNYGLLDNHLENTDIHVTAEDKANWNNKQGSLSQAQLDAIAQVATNTSDIATLQSGKADTSHTHSSSDITDIGDYATKQYVDNSISGLVDNAPDALNTLNELSAALNDDSNFASTVTTALAGKADSSDLATVATTGSYNDLTDKPTINDSTITIQKNGSTVDTFTTNGSNKTINISVPTKTSDLTNDSNFVGTSNAAVASGITSAKVTDYDTHIADTDIHVTTADKDRWNNQTYVFRYSSTALVASSTNSNALLDNTDNLKVGDKVIDSSGVLFSITAIDTANSTFTIGTALIDLAQDSDVVHKSGDETVSGTKTFTNNNMIKTSSPKVLLINTSQTGNTAPSSNTASFLRFDGGTVNNFGGVQCEFLTTGENRLTNYVKDITTAKINSIQQRANSITAMTVFNADLLTPTTDGVTGLGSSAKRWSDIYGMNYYYGSDNTEFSTKFVTTDTNQTINGNKTFGNGTLTVNNSVGSNVHGEIKLNGSRSGYIVADNSYDGVFDSAGCGISILLQDAGKPLHIAGYKVDSNGRVFADNTNKNSVLSITSSLVKTSVLVPENDTGNSAFRILSQLDYANGNPSKILDVRFIQYDNASGSSAIYSNDDGKTLLGVSSKKWSDVLTYKVNGVEPSSLSLPSGNLNDVIDISSYFSNTGSGDTNTYTALANGWIYLRLGDISGYQATILDANNNRMWGQSSMGNVEQITIPILKGQTLSTQWNTSSTVYVAIARFIPCQGNV